MATNRERGLRTSLGPEVCHFVLVTQLAFHIALLRLYLRLTGQAGDVGSNYLAFWILAVVPMTILLAALFGWGYKRLVADRIERKPLFFVAFVVIDAVFLLCSFLVYSERLQG
jgi:hypothetical protein